jgi:hypothetical protein
MLDYFRQVSIFDSALAMFLILGVNWAFTLLHILQEWKGEEVPLWRVFGAVIGLFVPNWLGFLSFTVALCLLQWLVGLIGITGWPDGVRPLAIAMIGALVGARLADSAVSHWLLYLRGYRPNPGLSSTVLYTIEAIFILVVFRKAYMLDPVSWRIGFLCGAGFFIVLVWAGLWLLRLLKPAWRRDKWMPGEPIPAWAREQR